ncbi:MAG: hypothetical protein IPJ65_30840 [Archangiaceae bacterium]|nr:hypothetical protein [Archangiaceae bacterium]
MARAARVPASGSAPPNIGAALPSTSAARPSSAAATPVLPAGLEPRAQAELELETPPRTPVTPVATPYSAGGTVGRIYDAEAYLLRWLRGVDEVVRLYHRTSENWGDGSDKTQLEIARNNGKNGAMWGQGLYTSTGVEEGFGDWVLSIELPLEAFRGQQLFVPDSLGNPTMPEGVDLLLTNGHAGTWLVFKQGAEAWLNEKATCARFDRVDTVDWR